MRNNCLRISHPYRAVLLVLVCVSVVAILSSARVEGASKPNMIFVLADDLGYGDLPCLNPDSTLKTPSVDRMAHEGMLFTDAHSGASLCTPTRYGVLTGRYCWRSSLKRGVLGGFSPPLIERDRLTVARLLKQQGYRTAAFGKWHLGMTWPTSNGQRPGTGLNEAGNMVDFSKKIEDAPTTRGFDRFLGISASLDMPPYVFIKDDHVEELPTETQEKWGYVRRGPKGPHFEFEDVLPKLTREVVSYVQEQEADQPFFVYFALNAPHTPIVPAEPFRGKSQVGDYGDFVQEVDWALGEVLKALDEKGLAENTLVIFTSDNGPETLAYPRIQEYHHYSMDGLRGVKRDAWEGGHRVPFLVRWPAQVKPGTVCRETICLTDFMATAADIVDARLPRDSAQDSVSLLPALKGEERSTPLREATVHHSGSGKFAIRRGPWVLIDAKSGDDNREPEWLKRERGYRPNEQPRELYNLSDDLIERRNVFAEHPEEVKALKAILERYKTEDRSVTRSE